MSALAKSQIYHYTEPEDCLMADPFGAETFHQYNQTMIDPGLESLRHHYAEYGLSYKGWYQPHAHLPAAYDPAAHGFGYAIPIKHEQQDLYSMALSTDWHSHRVDHRNHPYVSPTVSTMSLPRSASAFSDMSSPPISGGMLPPPPHHGSLDAYSYPSPPASEYQEVRMSYTPPDQPYPPADTMLPSQPSFSMRDFEYAASDNGSDDAFGEEDDPPVHVTGPEVLDILEEATPGHEQQRNLAKTPVDESDDDDDDDDDAAATKANSDAEEIESDTDYHPTSRRSTLHPPLPTTTRTSPLLNPAHARIHKSTPSNTSRRSAKIRPRPKPKPRPRQNRRSTSSSASKLFPCPFAPFGCRATFPNKNEWKRHTTTQHLCLGFYRCDLGVCRLDHESGLTKRRGWNDFGRKDLFVQHGRRMHLEEVWGGAKAGVYEELSREEKRAWEEAMERVRLRCFVVRREAPVGVGCCVKGCKERKKWGWDERMEHVAGHWERGERREEGVDEGLLEWCVREGLVVEDGGRWVLRGMEGERVESGVEKGRRRVGRRGLRSEGEAERGLEGKDLLEGDIPAGAGAEVDEEEDEEEDAAYEEE